MNDNFDNFLENEKTQENKIEVKANDIILDISKNDPNFYYPVNYTEKKRIDVNMPSYFAKQHTFIGLNSTKRNNLFFLSDSEIVFANGCGHHVLDINTNKKTIYNSSEVKGVGCITVSKNNKYIAVGECGYFPSILIYEYNSKGDDIKYTNTDYINNNNYINIQNYSEEEEKKLKHRLYRILRKGTEQAYSALSFNDNCSLLASAGSDPDHNLIIWDWMTENIILKAKAFSQEVYSVDFSSNFEGKLITSGMGHIKFWEMAKTFTGLKLQGELGKFGQVDLSDVSSYIEFPDGKILCGTEQGTLLLWEGIFIKTQITVSENEPCHGYLEDENLRKEQEEYNNISIKNKKDKLNTSEINNENETNNINDNDNDNDNNLKVSYNFKDFSNKMIECLFWEKEETIISAGYDGNIKWWNYEHFENAEIDDNSNSYIKPINTYFLINPATKLPAKIVKIIANYDTKLPFDNNNNYILQNVKNPFWIIQDGNGSIIKADIGFNNNLNISYIKELSIIYDFHAGKIVNLSNLDNTNYVISQGKDTKSFVHNYINFTETDDKIILSKHYVKELYITASYIQTPIIEGEDSLLIYNGYNNGLLRVYQFYSNKEIDSGNINNRYKNNLINQLKIHDTNIEFLLISPDRNWLLSATSNEVFILLIESPSKLKPLFFIRKDSLINDIDWLSDSKNYVLALSDGSIEQITVSVNNSPSSETFELKEYTYKKTYIRNSYNYIEGLDAGKKKKLKATDDSCRSKVLSVKYAGFKTESDFLVTCGHPYNDFIFLCTFDIDYIQRDDIEVIDNYLYTNLRPIDFWKIEPPKAIISKLKSTSAAAVLSLSNNIGDDVPNIASSKKMISINENTKPTLSPRRIIASTQSILSSGGAAITITSSNPVLENKEEELNKSLKNILVIKLVSKELIIGFNLATYSVHIFHKLDLSISIELYANPVSNNILTAASCFASSNRMINLGFSDGTLITYIIDIDSMTRYIGFRKKEYIKLKDELKQEFNEDEYKTKLETFLENQLKPMLHSNIESNLNYCININKSTTNNNKDNLKVLDNIYYNSEYEVINEQGFLKDNNKSNLIQSINDFIQLKSLEKQRIDKENEEKEKQAKEKKDKLKLKIFSLREEFNKILEQNNLLQEELKLTPNELIIDDEYVSSIKSNINNNLDDIKHKYEWLKAIVQGTIDRYTLFYLSSVKTHKVYCYTLNKEKKRNFVATIRCPALPENFEEMHSKFSEEIFRFKNEYNFEALDKEYETYTRTDDNLDMNYDEEIKNLVNKIDYRINEFKLKTDTKSGEKVDFGKEIIKDELEDNTKDMTELVSYKKNREEKKIRKNTRYNSIASSTYNRSSSFIGKKTNYVPCPNSYSLKINYETDYDETTMKTTIMHRLVILEFLKVLYDDRENFNNEVFLLLEKKKRIIENVANLKNRIIGINNDLGIRSVTKNPNSVYLSSNKQNNNQDNANSNMQTQNNFNNISKSNSNINTNAISNNNLMSRKGSLITFGTNNEYYDISNSVSIYDNNSNIVKKASFSASSDIEDLDWMDLTLNEEELVNDDNYIKLSNQEIEDYAKNKYVEENINDFDINKDINSNSTNNTNTINAITNTNTTTNNLNKNNSNVNNDDANLPFLYNNGLSTLERNPNYSEAKVSYKDRGARNCYKSQMSVYFNQIKTLKLSSRKKKIIDETLEMINEFDKEVLELRKKKVDIHFKQKLGELELYIKHEEYNILRAFETDDNILIKSLEDLFREYQSNLSELKEICNSIATNKDKAEKTKIERDNKIAEFEKLIEAEKENKPKLIKIFYAKKKKDDNNKDNDQLDEDELENERPKNVTPNLFNEIITKRDDKDIFESTIQQTESAIAKLENNKRMKIQNKEFLDSKRNAIRSKINAQERKKSKYLNLIEISFPLKLDQFCKFEGGYTSNPKLSLDISRAILISRNKIKHLDEVLLDYKQKIEDFKIEEIKIAKEKKIKAIERLNAENELKEAKVNFIKEQNLKFGTEIKFDNLLKAAVDNTIDRLDAEYKSLKKEADKAVDSRKLDEYEYKEQYKKQVVYNTKLLKEIRELLVKNKGYDDSLEEKNNEINKKKDKKYELFNVKEKKMKLKEILLLLKQQMDALKKEIEIFRKKGGHIYSTITSNLN